MKKPLKIYPVSDATASTNWMPGGVCWNMEQCDIVLFPGGADIDPSFYNAKAHPKTRTQSGLDGREIAKFYECIERGKKMIGICRGAQLLCAMAGGKLVQDQANMGIRHPMYTHNGKCIEVSSSHHQAMFPWHMKEGDFKVLGWSIGQSEHHQDGDLQEMVVGEVPLDMEVEAAYFPTIDALCLQPHPEWQYHDRHNDLNNLHAIEWYNSVLEKFMDGHKFEDAHKSFSTTPVAAKA